MLMVLLYHYITVCPLRQDTEERAKALRSWRMLLGSGACLAVHFGAWVWGLQHTSLTHSLLFVSATPILLAGWAWLSRQPISSTEVRGGHCAWLCTYVCVNCHVITWPSVRMHAPLRAQAEELMT